MVTAGLPHPSVAGCPFCEIMAGRAPATVLREWSFDGITGLVPLRPVALGHTLFIPNGHIPSALADPVMAGRVFERAARFAAWQGAHGYNLITSAGVAATQTVFHLHVHVVPRRPEDGLPLPWTGQQLREPDQTLATLAKVPPELVSGRDEVRMVTCPRCGHPAVVTPENTLGEHPLPPDLPEDAPRWVCSGVGLTVPR